VHGYGAFRSGVPLPGGAWRLDVNQRNTITGLQNGRALIGRSIRIGADLGIRICACKFFLMIQQPPRTQAHGSDASFNTIQESEQRNE